MSKIRKSGFLVMVSTAALLLALACQAPRIIEVPIDRIVTQEVVKEVPVEKVVTQEVEKVVTQEVEKVVTQEVVTEVSVPMEALDPLIVGQLNVFTGSLSYFGTTHRNAAALAADHVNRAGGIQGASVVIISRDTAVNPVQGVDAARALVSVETPQPSLVHWPAA